MMACMLLLIPLTCAFTWKITILIQMIKINEILIVFNEKPNIRKISKVITTDMSH